MRSMIALPFLSEVTAPTTSVTFDKSEGNSLACLEIYGTATSFSLKLQGIMDRKNTNGWSDIGYVSSTFTTGTDITTKGKYDFSIDGYSKLQVVLSAVSGGNLIVWGKAGN